MLLLKYMLLIAGVVIFGTGGALVCYDIYLSAQLERLLRRGGERAEPPPERSARPIRWRSGAKLVAAAIVLLLLATSITVVPDGMAAVRISQISGVQPGTLYPGVHFVLPFVQRLALFDVRDHVFSTAAAGETKKGEALEVEAREGLPIGLAIAVRYRLDPSRLDYIQSNLPQPVEQEIVAPVIASVFRDVAPNYVVREVFATKRGEFRERAAGIIAARLKSDGIVVKEVLLRQVQLPEEYAKGLEGLLLKEQEDERMGVETEIQQKQVRIAELRAEADKVRQVKHAEADAQSRVIGARAESDSMQYTLPLKQKQIEQAKLEAQARKESTIENAEAAAKAKVIDSQAEQQRRKLLAEAEAERIRLTSAAEADQMKMEAQALKVNPMLIQKIIAERLSDKVQIMMVPTDGKFFFTQDVLRSMPVGAGDGEKDPEDPPRVSNRRP